MRHSFDPQFSEIWYHWNDTNYTAHPSSSSYIIWWCFVLVELLTTFRLVNFCRRFEGSSVLAFSVWHGLIWCGVATPMMWIFSNTVLPHVFLDWNRQYNWCDKRSADSASVKLWRDELGWLLSGLMDSARTIRSRDSVTVTEAPCYINPHLRLKLKLGMNSRSTL
jgi:membrane glycosyltransferase